MLNRLISAYRGHRLARQLRHIETHIQALPRHRRERLGLLTLRELDQASWSATVTEQAPNPPEVRAADADQGYARARSGNSELALRGMAQWLAVAYQQSTALSHTTRRAPDRRVLRVVRELKELAGSTGPVPARRRAAANQAA